MACYLSPVRHSARHINPFFPRFPAQDLAPLFKLFDESFEPVSRSVRSFQPRFDVREEKDAFHLQGELPGINQQDVKIEFADQNTLIIHGRTVRESARGTPPTAAGAVEGTSEKETPTTADASGPNTATAEGSGSRASSVSHQATVEDEDGGAPTPATTATATSEQQQQQQQTNTSEDVARKEKKPSSTSASRYWVSERSVGEFHRSFNFPGHVDQDAVKASLKNGILSVIVPKASAKEPKKITVE